MRGMSHADIVSQVIQAFWVRVRVRVRARVRGAAISHHLGLSGSFQSQRPRILGNYYRYLWSFYRVWKYLGRSFRFPSGKCAKKLSLINRVSGFFQLGNRKRMVMVRKGFWEKWNCSGLLFLFKIKHLRFRGLSQAFPAQAVIDRFEQEGPELCSVPSLPSAAPLPDCVWQPGCPLLSQRHLGISPCALLLIICWRTAACREEYSKSVWRGAQELIVL